MPKNYGMSHTGFEFKKKWCTTPDGTGQKYDDGENLTKEEVDALFDSSDDESTVHLYALWISELPPQIGEGKIGKDIYRATKKLEKFMTFRTWESIRKANNDADGTVSFTGSKNYTVNNETIRNKRNTYNAELGIYEEIINIVQRTNDYDYTAFFDLSTDFTYYDKHSGQITLIDNGTSVKRSKANGDGAWGGLFKFTLFEEDYRLPDEDFNLFRIIKAIANGYDTGDEMYDNAAAYNNVGCLDGTNGKDYDFKFYGQGSSAYYIKETYDINNSNEGTADAEKKAESMVKQIRYRSHTSFNIKNAWSRRNENASIAKAYADYIKPYIRDFLQGLQDKKGSDTTFAEMNLSDDEIKSIMQEKNVPWIYFDYAKSIIVNNSTVKLTNVATINNLVDNAKIIPEQDPLYVRIESEELNEGTNDRYGTLVRQIWLNVDENYKAENNRPMVIFYEGPDRGLSEAYDAVDLSNGQAPNPSARYPGLRMRNSQPVILNLNADFKGILFAPNSPVAIIGKEHKLEG